jgi:hypothetical protein
MVDPNAIPAPDRARTPLSGSIRDFLGRFSPAELTSVVAIALCVASGIAFYAPGWWLAGLLAFSIGAAALAGAADRRIAALVAPGMPHRLPITGALCVVRGLAAALATVSAIAFVLVAVAMVMGSPGADG